MAEFERAAGTSHSAISLRGIVVTYIGESDWHLRAQIRMRCVFLLVVAALTACSPTANDAPTTSPVSPQPTNNTLLSDPAADHRLLGRIYTIGDMHRLEPITEVKVERDLNAEWAEKNGAERIPPDNLEQLLLIAKAVAPDDKLLDEWSYAPWDWKWG